MSNLKSLTHGNVEIDEVARLIFEYLMTKSSGEDNHIVIGTDSQNFSDTKVVAVIAIYTEGKGGKFFYDVTRVKKIMNVQQKLHMETAMSLEYADKLITELDKLKSETGFDYNKHCSIGIHVDAGYNGKSGVVIPELVGWITAMGYDVCVKPESFVASTIADRISK